MKLFLLLLVLTGFVLAQKDKDKKDEPWPVDVHVNLLVTDAAQKPVTDLKLGDIKLFENDVAQKVNYLAYKPVSNVAFVIDNSGSVRTQLDLIMRIGVVITSNLDDTNEAMIVRFVGSDKITAEQTWTTDKAKLKDAFENMFVEGGRSAVRDGIYLAAGQLLEQSQKQPDKRFALILISDGVDLSSFYTDKQLLSLISGTAVQVFAIGLTRELKESSPLIGVSEKERAERFLHTLAVRTGGATYILGKKYTTDDVKAAVMSVIDELRSPYVIAYSSTDQKHSGETRKLRIEIADGPNGEKRTAVFRSNFVVPKE